MQKIDTILKVSQDSGKARALYKKSHPGYDGMVNNEVLYRN